MFVFLFFFSFEQEYNVSTRILVPGIYIFNDCIWIDCKTNGHGGCIFFSVTSSKLSVKSCSFVKAQCTSTNNEGGAICIMHCDQVIIENTCFLKCYASGSPSYTLWSGGYSLLKAKLNLISELFGRSDLHGSVSGGRESQEMTNSNCSRVSIPVYCGGIAFHPCGNSSLGRYCQVCDSYTEGMVSFVVGSGSFEISHWNLINNTIPSGCWFCFHNQSPSIVIKSTIIKLTSHMTSLFSMNGGATLSFYDCSFDVDNIYSFFGARATNCSFLTPVSNHMISIYSNVYCIDMNNQAHTIGRPSIQRNIHFISVILLFVQNS